MVRTPDVRSPGTPSARYSLSPKPGGSATRRNLDEPEISSDENDEDSEDEREEDNTGDSYSERTQNRDGLRLRVPPSYEFESASFSDEFEAESAARSKAAVETPPREFSDLRDSSGVRGERARRPSSFSKKDSTRSNLPLYLCVLFLLGSVCLYYWGAQGAWDRRDESPIKSKQPRVIEDFKDNVRKIRKIFPSQDSRIWNDIAAGVIEVIGGAKEPWIFVLFSNETMELSCLAKMLGSASSEALHSDGSLQLYPKNLSDDYGLVIDRLKPTITEKRAVVVYDVLNINPQAIQAFHTMCDRITPLVKGVVYILTILTSGDIPEFQKPVDFIENQLTSRFVDKVPEEKLQPLITRLTDGPLIPVKSELGLTRCPL